MILSEHMEPHRSSPGLEHGKPPLPPGVLRVAANLRAISPPSSRGRVIMVAPVTENLPTGQLARDLAQALELLHESPVLVLDAQLGEPSQREDTTPTVECTFENGTGTDSKSMALALQSGENRTLTLARVNPSGLSPASLFSSPMFAAFVQDACNRFRYIVVEGACLTRSDETLILEQHADGVILVVSAEKSTIQEVCSSRDEVTRGGGNLLGFIWDQTVHP